jgi:hypothetical protein
MKKPVLVALSPCKKVSESFKPMFDGLRKGKLVCMRAIIYCHLYSTCADIYIYPSHGLGYECTEPIDAPNTPRSRLVDMYTSVTDKHHKDEIIDLFTEPSQLRIVIATITVPLD